MCYVGNQVIINSANFLNRLGKKGRERFKFSVWCDGVRGWWMGRRYRYIARDEGVQEFDKRVEYI